MSGTISSNHWERKLLDLIQSDKKISVRKMSKALQLSTSTVQNHLDKLKEKGLLNRIGEAHEDTGKSHLSLPREAKKEKK